MGVQIRIHSYSDHPRKGLVTKYEIKLSKYKCKTIGGQAALSCQDHQRKERTAFAVRPSL